MKIANRVLGILGVTMSALIASCGYTVTNTVGTKILINKELSQRTTTAKGLKDGDMVAVKFYKVHDVEFGCDGHTDTLYEVTPFNEGEKYLPIHNENDQVSHGQEAEHHRAISDIWYEKGIYHK